jgi:mycoredoxin
MRVFGRSVTGQTHSSTWKYMITVYSAPWCGPCRRLKSRLTQAGIPYTEVNVDDTPGAVELISELNGGSWLIPTVVFSDGSALVNPSLEDVRSRLRHDCSPTARRADSP